MLGSGIAMWQICCRIVVSLSVGGVHSRCPCSGEWSLALTSIVVVVVAAIAAAAVDDDDDDVMCVLAGVVWVSFG